MTLHLLADAPVALSTALESITYGPYVVAAVLTDESERMPWDDMYAIVVANKSFNMLFNTVNVLRQHGPRLPGGSLTMYGAASLARSLLQVDDSNSFGHSFVRHRVEAAVTVELPWLIYASVPSRATTR